MSKPAAIVVVVVVVVVSFQVAFIVWNFLKFASMFCQQIYSTLKRTHHTNTAMNRNILFGFGILTLLTITVLLTEAIVTTRKGFHERRFIRRQRPTRKPTRRYLIPVDPPQERPQNEIRPDFDNREGVEEYWTDIYENGKSLFYSFSGKVAVNAVSEN